MRIPMVSEGFKLRRVAKIASGKDTKRMYTIELRRMLRGRL